MKITILYVLFNECNEIFLSMSELNSHHKCSHTVKLNQQYSILML